MRGAVSLLRFFGPSLRHTNIAESLEAESLALTLVQRALGRRTTHSAGASVERQLLVDRAKLVLTSDLARRWTLAEIATKCAALSGLISRRFPQSKACPCNRYQLRLRLARACIFAGEAMTT